MVARKLPLAALVLIAACSKVEAPANTAEAEPEPGSREWQIRNARSAAPPMVGAQSMVVMVRDTTMALDTLQLGDSASSWVCFVDDAATPHSDPVCADDQAMRWFQALMTRQRPQLTGMGVAYALQGGGAPNDRDPFDMTPDSTFVNDGPSIYIVMPNAASYTGLPTTRQSARPWVRYSGTPYAYIVVPAASPAAAAGIPAATTP